MGLTSKDVTIVNAIFITREVGVTVEETFKVVLPVMGTPFMVNDGTLSFENVLQKGYECWCVTYIITNICVTGMVLVSRDLSIAEACLDHFTKQRDITHKPIIFKKGFQN